MPVKTQSNYPNQLRFGSSEPDSLISKQSEQELIEQPVEVAVIVDQKLPVLGFISWTDSGRHVLLLLLWSIFSR